MSSNEDSLGIIEDKAKILDGHICNLSRSLGLFHGINERFRSRIFDGVGSESISVLLFDQLHLIVNRVSALIARPKQSDDITFQDFALALADDEMSNRIAYRASCWYGLENDPELFSEYKTRASRLRSSIHSMESRESVVLRRFRNKALAHVTLDAKLESSLQIKTIWRLANRSIVIGHNIQLLFRERQSHYFSEMARVKQDARRMIGIIRAADSRTRRSAQSRGA